MSYRWKARKETTAVNVCKSTVVQNHPLLSRTAVTTSVGVVKGKAKGRQVLLVYKYTQYHL